MDESARRAVIGCSTMNDRDQATSNRNEGIYMKFDGEAHQSTHLLLGRHDPCSPMCTFVAPRAHCTNRRSTARGAAQQIQCETITRDMGISDTERLFLADEVLSTGIGDYNLDSIFDGLKSASPVLASQVQNKFLGLEGRTVPGDLLNALLKPAIMNRASRVGLLGRRKVSDANEIGESTVFRRKFLLKEETDACARMFPNSADLNCDNDGVHIDSTSRVKEIDEDDFPHVQESGSLAQRERQKIGEGVGGRRALAENDWDLHEREEEVLVKALGWITFPVEFPGETNDTTHSLRWILDELPSASDLPHLESLMEISPSKFWSPNTESSKRAPVQFGYLNSSASPQSSHSIQYFLNDSPVSSPEMKRTILGSASGLRIASKDSNRRCSQAFRNIHGTTRGNLTPRRVNEASMEAGCELPSGSDISFSPNSYLFSSPLHQDHRHHRESPSANLTAADTAACRLKHTNLGKNLVTDFLEVGRTQENVEAKRTADDIPHKDTTTHTSGTSCNQNENTPEQTRLQCLTGSSGKGSESATPSLELQIVRGVDENWLTKRTFERVGDDPLLPRSDVSSVPSLVTSLRNSLHEKLEFQLLYNDPLPDSQRAERIDTLQCSGSTPASFASGNMAVPRVSRKRSDRITTPKRISMDVLNLFGSVKEAQPLRNSPVKDFYPDKRRKTTRSRSEIPTSLQDVKALSPTPADCEIDLKGVGTLEGTSSKKSTTLARIINPFRIIKSITAKGYTCVPKTRSLRSTVRKRLPSDLRNESATHAAKSDHIQHFNDAGGADEMSDKNPGSRRSLGSGPIVKEGCLRTLPASSENSNGMLRSSKYRGVTRHRHTGRYEAHLWDNTKVKLGLAKRGRQVYLGAYPNEDEAAQAHDLAALKYWGPKVYTNFQLSLYEEELKAMKNLTKEEYIVILRRHHQEGRWEARIGRHSGAKYHYLGTYDTQEEAAAAYDRAAVRHRGVNAITNFDISNYIKTKSKTLKTVSPSSTSSGSPSSCTVRWPFRF